jgi:hypothetical protein
MKKADTQWLLDPNQSNIDNLKNARCEASRHFLNKEKEYAKAKIDEFETNCKTKKIRDIRTGASRTLRRVTRLE